jgi:rSAM/selenodomain-associated transferase 2
MTISIIIPTLNEADNIGQLINFLKTHADNSLLEIIVVDAHSADDTEGVARTHGAIAVQSPRHGRAVQMNYGAHLAKGDVLYFIHADCQPPTSFLSDIKGVVKGGGQMGCFCYRFDSQKVMLKINSYFTRFSPMWCRGGDETFFIRKQIFEQLGGYDERFCIMEEYDFLRRAKRQFPLTIVPKNCLVSARKYETNSWLRVQLANMLVFNMFKLGFAPATMKRTYATLLRYR